MSEIKGYTDNQVNLLQAYEDEMTRLEVTLQKMKEQLAENKDVMKQSPNLKTLGQLVSCHMKIQVAIDHLDSI